MGEKVEAGWEAARVMARVESRAVGTRAARVAATEGQWGAGGDPGVSGGGGGGTWVNWVTWVVGLLEARVVRRSRCRRQSPRESPTCL